MLWWCSAKYWPKLTQVGPSQVRQLIVWRTNDQLMNDQAPSSSMVQLKCFESGDVRWTLVADVVDTRCRVYPSRALKHLRRDVPKFSIHRKWRFFLAFSSTLGDILRNENIQTRVRRPEIAKRCPELPFSFICFDTPGHSRLGYCM